ncbi:hypothetical protein [Methanofollis aquaemaris]|uniref:hypothetical protein n=1 Tax=Methanofollis aquaemaris TaxID=126734 RepID=UPI002AD58589|nr:hypothetical protein [Methanofollis aquaemaris]
MESRFGRGFVIPIVALSKHFALKPEQAFLGAADHLTERSSPTSSEAPGSKTSSPSSASR